MSLFEFSIHPKLLAYVGLILPLAVQAALLHPYYQRIKSATLIRRSLTPIPALMAFATAPARKWQPLSDSMMTNFCFVALVTFHVTCLGFEYGLYDGPIIKTSKKDKDSIDSPEGTSGFSSGNGESRSTGQDGIQTAHRPSEETRDEAHRRDVGDEAKSQFAEHDVPAARKPSAGQLVRFVIWLLFSPRGLECHWAPHPSTLKFREPISIGAFFAEQVIRTLKMHIYGTLCWALAIYGFRHPRGLYGLIIDHTGLPESAVLEYVTGYGLSFCVGASMWTGLEIATCGMNTFELLFYPLARAILPKDWAPENPFDPRRYPLLFSRPWQRSSIRDFWGNGWHALFRRDLTFCGAFPLVKIANLFRCSVQVQKAVGLMGAMFLSAVMHEYAITSVSMEKQGLQIIWFFMQCGVLMLVEDLIETHTYFKFQGLWGRIWTFGWLMYLGKPGMDLWRERGLGQTLRPITEWRWSQILFPAGYTLPPNWFYALPF